jgi:hypothetical protein
MNAARIVAAAATTPPEPINHDFSDRLSFPDEAGSDLVDMSLFPFLLCLMRLVRALTVPTHK